MAGIIKFKRMAPVNDMMKFSNLDCACLNLLAYQWTRVGPPGTLAVDQITDCFADIPKVHVHKTLTALDKEGFILLEFQNRSASLTRKGFDRVRRAITKPICARVRSHSRF